MAETEDFVQAISNLNEITEEVPELSDEATHPLQQSQHSIAQMVDDQIYEDMEQSEISSLPTAIQEDKSSSFPFESLNALCDQSSIDATAHTTDSLDNLLANLTEDNANSLPSGGDELSLQYVPEVGNESSSEPAIAEELANGNSSDTKNDALDAEMVSEDELPAPTVSKVDDAEEVSDEELPGPKRAELPEDTEVVSEEELPTSNKTKRKAEDGYDPASPTDTDVAEKRVKIDDESELIAVFF